MDKQALLDRVKSLWPDAITLRPDGGQDALNNVYWPIEQNLENDGDEWTALSAWAFHQALWDLARTKVGVGCSALRPADVTLEAFDYWMRNSLSDDTWAAARQKYDEASDWPLMAGMGRKRTPRCSQSAADCELGLKKCELAVDTA